MKDWEYLEYKWPWPISKRYLGIYLEILSKNMKYEIFYFRVKFRRVCRSGIFSSQHAPKRMYKILVVTPPPPPGGNSLSTSDLIKPTRDNTASISEHAGNVATDLHSKTVLFRQRPIIPTPWSGLRACSHCTNPIMTLRITSTCNAWVLIRSWFVTSPWQFCGVCVHVSIQLYTTRDCLHIVSFSSAGTASSRNGSYDSHFFRVF
jgi:hypothetical protein